MRLAPAVLGASLAAVFSRIGASFAVAQRMMDESPRFGRPQLGRLHNGSRGHGGRYTPQCAGAGSVAQAKRTAKKRRNVLRAKARGENTRRRFYR